MHKAVKCAISRFYRTYQDAIQIGGFLIMFSTIVGGIGTTAWIGFKFINQANANTERIDHLESWQSEISIALARFEQKVDDIHDVVVKK